MNSRQKMGYLSLIEEGIKLMSKTKAYIDTYNIDKLSGTPEADRSFDRKTNTTNGKKIFKNFLNQYPKIKF